MDEGRGCRLKDVDGNTYIDFLNNHSSLIHGHRHPHILEAVEKAISHDFIYGGPCVDQYKLADIISQRIPSIDHLRFTNSGTEATMMGIRTARAFKKRDIIIKMDGCYHGSHDFVSVNVDPDLSGEWPPKGKPEAGGVPECVLDAVKIARFNDLASVEAILKKYSGQVAAIITEPVMFHSCCIPANIDFLKGLRALADQYDTLLIFDEVVTFRLSTGGMQKMIGVIPDITTLGKIIGGSFPIGAFGGSKEIMSMYDPANPSCYHHSGTFNGHNVIMSAGIATMELLDTAAIEHINSLGERLQCGINKAFETAGISSFVTGTGSLLNVHWTNKPVTDAIDIAMWKEQASDLPRMFHLELLNRGVFCGFRGLFNPSTPMTTTDIDQTVEKIVDTLIYLKPYVQEKAPHLIC
jgi:glutamate-1-semialdehyde 2,1-aminomutase